MTGQRPLPEWMRAGSKVIVVHTGHQTGPTVRRGVVTRTLARDLVITEARNETTREVRVWREHFQEDGLGGHYDRADRLSDRWNTRHTMVFAHDHPRAVALEAAATADVKIWDLEKEIQDLRKARGSRDSGLYPAHPEKGPEMDLADRATLVIGSAQTTAQAITRAMGAASTLVALERAAKDRAKRRPDG